jgi:hypothetical protein
MKSLQAREIGGKIDVWNVEGRIDGPRSDKGSKAPHRMWRLAREQCVEGGRVGGPPQPDYRLLGEMRRSGGQARKKIARKTYTVHAAAQDELLPILQRVVERTGQPAERTTIWTGTISNTTLTTDDDEVIAVSPHGVADVIDQWLIAENGQGLVAAEAARPATGQYRA